MYVESMRATSARARSSAVERCSASSPSAGAAPTPWNSLPSLSLTACVPLLTQSGAPLMPRSLSTTVLPPPQAASATAMTAAAMNLLYGCCRVAIFMMNLPLDEDSTLTDDLAERIPRRHAAGFHAAERNTLLQSRYVNCAALLCAIAF